MPLDALLDLQASVTKTATFNGAGVAMPMGSPHRNSLVARVTYSALTQASGTGTVSWQIDYSPDGGTTWYSNIATSETITMSTTAQSGEVLIPFVTPIDGNVKTTVQVRLTCTIGGSPTTPTVTYFGSTGLAMAG